MEPNLKLKLLSKDMHLEPDGDHSCRPVINGREYNEIPISDAVLPNGKTIRLLKTMQTSACERNCYYCPFQTGRSMRRATFKPDELADSFMRLHKAKTVEGIFLSSGIIGGGIKTQDKLLDTAEILRYKHHYKGYLHMKIMPGSEFDQLERAMELASRVSINLEAPNSERLENLAPKKNYYNELLLPLKWADHIRREKTPNNTWNGRWPSTVTQFVVGAAGESDLELIATSDHLYNQFGLQRAYYSAFKPIEDTPLDHLPPEDPLREHRLYQASFLLRDYNFTLEDMPFTHDGNLPLNVDPKLAWAEHNLTHTPVEVNTARRELLLRVPGIGPKGVNSILIARKQRRINDIHQLKRLGINIKRASDFVLLDGKLPSRQLALL